MAVHAGRLGDRVTVYRERKQATETGERETVQNLVGSYWSHRKDAPASEVTEGKPIAVTQVEFTFRNANELTREYANLIIEDHDGQFEIIGAPTFIERKAFIVHKAIKRE